MLDQLIRFGYDHSLLISSHMQVFDELDEKLPTLCIKTMDASWDYYGSCGQEFSMESKLSTVQRFSLTAGIGATWIFYQRPDDVAARDLFDLLSESRGFSEIDEYIEDMVGIGFHASSLEHQTLMRLWHDCMHILQQHYNLEDKTDEMKAAMVMITFGALLGFTMVVHADTLKPHRSQEGHFAVWTALHGSNRVDEKGATELEQWALRTCNHGEFHQLISVPRAEFGHDRTKTYILCRTFTFPQNAPGALLRTTVRQEEDGMTMLTATPEFRTHSRCILILDEVQVWRNRVEATIVAHSFGGKCKFTFFDTNYLESKDLYWRGRAYIFDLYGIAYTAQRAAQQATSSFIQANAECPEDAEFCLMVDEVNDDVKFLEHDVQALTVSFSTGEDDTPRRFPLFMAAGASANFAQQPLQPGEMISGLLRLQGRMLHEFSFDEEPPAVLHTFSAMGLDGKATTFDHHCQPGEKGLEMNAQERQDFAKQVFANQFSYARANRLRGGMPEEEQPDFETTNSKLIWVRPDAHNQAQRLFDREDRLRRIFIYYLSDRIPVKAYVTLCDQQGNPCPWLKGGRYTAKISYGCMIPAQRMPYGPDCLNQKQLMEFLEFAFNRQNIWDLATYIDKDIDYRSPHWLEPITSREEFINLTQFIFRAIKDGRSSFTGAKLEGDERSGYRVRLKYATHPDNILTTKTRGGYITAITISQEKPEA